MQHHAFLYHAQSLADTTIPHEFHIPSVDVTHVVTDVISIGDVRSLRTDASRLPLGGSMRVFVVVAREIALEAQQALLKILEEPPATTRFYFVLPKTVRLLATVRSRLCEATANTKTQSEDTAIDVFMEASVGEQLKVIAEKTKEKDVAWVESFLARAELYTKKKNDTPGIAAVVFARERLGVRGASVKMLLEHVILSRTSA